MSKSYYQPEDLSKFGNINEWNPKLGKKFFEYYEAVFQKGFFIGSREVFNCF